jgi:hypothetical protein
MKKLLLNSLLILLVSFGIQAQEEDERMGWVENALTWENFQAAPDPDSPFSANTSSGISYSWSLKTSVLGKEYHFEVESFFNPHRSWVKGSASAHLLAHEQLHFDITELHARKLRKALTEFDFKKSREVKPALQKIYQDVEKQRALMQQKFDRETRHSMNKEAQLEWQNYVAEELKELEGFSS